MQAVSAVIALASLTFCTRPSQTEIFLRSDKASDGVYIYKFPLTDSLSAYDFWFFSRADNKPLDNVELRVRWLAPSGNSIAETVFMKHIGTGGTRELYRSNMVPAEYGVWQLSVRPVNVDEDFLGLGVICKERNGAR